MPFTVTVRDHMMIAHSFSGEVFGPAQRLHGATFVVDATFGADELDADGLVLDIGWASEVLRGILGALTYRNLDDDPAFAGMNTTTERLCQVVADRLAVAVGGGGAGGGDAVGAVGDGTAGGGTAGGGTAGGGAAGGGAGDAAGGGAVGTVGGIAGSASGGSGAASTGSSGASAVTSISVTLHESHIAWASYSRAV